MAGASEAGDVVKAKFSFIAIKINRIIFPFTSCLGGEIWKNVPNTDFAYYSTHGRFSSSKDVGFPGNGCILCTEDELKKEVNEWADPDNSGKDFFTLWMAQAKESEEE